MLRYLDDLSEEEINKDDDFIEDYEDEVIKKNIKITKKSAKESFEDSYNSIYSYPLNLRQEELNNLLEKDFNNFKDDIEKKFSNNPKDCISKNYDFYSISNAIIKKLNNEFYLDPFARVEDKLPEYEDNDFDEYKIKRDFKESYYLETKIHEYTGVITKTIHPLYSRNLYVNNINQCLFSSLISEKRSKSFFELIKELHTKELTKQPSIIALSFFCYDYYNAKIKIIEKKNEKIQKENENNVWLQEAIENIALINRDTTLTTKQKNEEKKTYCLTKKKEEKSILPMPSLSIKSKNFIFKSQGFKYKGINEHTALKYYKWIAPFIENKEYKKFLFNSE